MTPPLSEIEAYLAKGARFNLGHDEQVGLLKIARALQSDLAKANKLAEDRYTQHRQFKEIAEAAQADNARLERELAEGLQREAVWQANYQSQAQEMKVQAEWGLKRQNLLEKTEKERDAARAELAAIKAQVDEAAHAGKLAKMVTALGAMDKLHREARAEADALRLIAEAFRGRLLDRGLPAISIDKALALSRPSQAATVPRQDWCVHCLNGHHDRCQGKPWCVCDHEGTPLAGAEASGGGKPAGANPGLEVPAHPPMAAKPASGSCCTLAGCDHVEECYCERTPERIADCKCKCAPGAEKAEANACHHGEQQARAEAEALRAALIHVRNCERPMWGICGNCVALADKALTAGAAKADSGPKGDKPSNPPAAEPPAEPDRLSTERTCWQCGMVQGQHTRQCTEGGSAPHKPAPRAECHAKHYETHEGTRMGLVAVIGEREELWITCPASQGAK